MNTLVSKGALFQKHFPAVWLKCSLLNLREENASGLSHFCLLLLFFTDLEDFTCFNNGMLASNGLEPFHD